jgi:hypothetical protein
MYEERQAYFSVETQATDWLSLPALGAVEAALLVHDGEGFFGWRYEQRRARRYTGIAALHFDGRTASAGDFPRPD